jgi:hypothetical protein
MTKILRVFEPGAGGGQLVKGDHWLYYWRLRSYFQNFTI